MSELKPRFIVFEGIEGAGKSTLIRQLASLLQSQGQDIIITREPGGTDIADRIRSLLLHPGVEPLHAYTELCLLAASRAQHVQQILKPAISSHKWILCDRFTDSTLAYQGYGRGLDLDTIKAINALVCDGITPDCVVLCDVDPALAMERIKKRKKDRIERESLEFFEKVRQGYRAIAGLSAKHYVLDSNVSEKQMLATLWSYLSKDYPL